MLPACLISSTHSSSAWMSCGQGKAGLCAEVKRHLKTAPSSFCLLISQGHKGNSVRLPRPVRLLILGKASRNGINRIINEVFSLVAC